MTIKLMLVDDAVVIRHVLSDALSKDPEFDVIGTGKDGVDAMEKLKTLKPDVVVLDVEMPKMDGIETLAAIKKNYPSIRVIMFSTLTSAGAQATMDALIMGADDYVTKPSNTGSMDGAVAAINAELVPKIKALAGSRRGTAPAFRAPGAPAASSAPAEAAPAARQRPARPGAAAQTPGRSTAGAGGRPQILAIAVSTGGPNALSALLPQLPANLSVPVVIVQHIPPVFSKALAERLDAKCALKVQEGYDGAVIQPGEVWIAPGDFHMIVRRDGQTVRLETNKEAQENSCRPAADVLFRSVSAVYGAACLGLVMTGMGSDGMLGARVMTSGGANVIAQDEATSVVWGMPGAVAQANITDGIYPLNELASQIVTRTGTVRSSAASGRVVIHH